MTAETPGTGSTPAGAGLAPCAQPEQPTRRQPGYLRELTVAYRRTAPPVPLSHRDECGSPDKAAALLRPLLDAEPCEVGGVLLLDARRKVIAWHVFSRGGLSQTIMSPALVFRTAILAHADSIIVAHNHPSGDPSPSQDDRDVTRRLLLASQVLGVDLADHIIIGSGTGQYFSFKQGGLL